MTRAARDLAREGFTRARQLLEPQLDVRYAGQSSEITVPCGVHYRREFDRRHEQRYGYADRDRPVEVVAVRVRAAGITEKPSLPFARPGRTFRPSPQTVRRSRFDGRLLATAFHRWPDLAPGAAGSGPAVITGPEATAVIPPGFRFHIDGFGNIVARRR
jgi:N-methylhydantoinase A/oxoprolinase/acetone carboxylase beta subunit